MKIEDALKKLKKLKKLYEGAKKINSEGEAAAGTASARNMGYKVGKNTDIYKPIASSRKTSVSNVKLL